MQEHDLPEVVTIRVSCASWRWRATASARISCTRRRGASPGCWANLICLLNPGQAAAGEITRADRLLFPCCTSPLAQLPADYLVRLQIESTHF